MRRFFTVFILLIAVVLVTLWVLDSMKPHIEVGRVDGKRALGIHGDVVDTLIDVSTELMAPGPEDKGAFFGIVDVYTVSDSEKALLLENHDALRYELLVRSCPADTSAVYRLSREDFNRLNLGTMAKFEHSGGPKDSILRLIEY
jgi:hypothetical protein